MDIREKQPAIAYLAAPPASTGKGVLVLHAWWGLNDFIKSLCDRLAAEGFVAGAPDLYGGRVATTVKEAQTMQSRFKRAAMRETLVGAVDQLANHPAVDGPRVGLVGLSLGAYWALWLAQQPALPVSAAVVFYGSTGGDYAPSQAAFQGHFAETDEYVPASGLQKLKRSLAAAGKEAEFYDYPGAGHWFFEADRPEAYNPQAAALAWERTVAFLHQRLG